MIVDFDNVGDSISDYLETAKFPNDCLNPIVMDIKSHEIGEWSDDHPLNKKDDQYEFYKIIFP